MTFEEFLVERALTTKPVEPHHSENMILFIRTGNIEDLETDLNAGGDPNWDYSNGWRPLHYAVREENMDIIDLLLKHGANPNIQNDMGQTPLHLAYIIKGRDKNIELLLKNGANPNIKDNKDRLPIDLKWEKRNA